MAADALKGWVGQLSGGRAARLYRNLVRTGVARDAFAYAFPLVTGASFFLVGATGFPDSDPEALAAALREQLHELRDADDAEVARGLALEEARLVRSLEHLRERADRISMNTMQFDRPERVTEELEILRAVTAEDVQEAATRWLAHDRHATLLYQPRESA